MRQFGGAGAGSAHGRVASLAASGGEAFVRPHLLCVWMITMRACVRACVRACERACVDDRVCADDLACVRACG